MKVSPKPLSTVLPGKKTALEAVLLEALLDLVDRYWSGYKSLHSNETFLAQARHILSSVQEFTATQDNSTIMNEEIHSLTLEKKSLQSHLAEQQNSVKMSEVLSELSHVQEEVVSLACVVFAFVHRQGESTALTSQTGPLSSALPRRHCWAALGSPLALSGPQNLLPLGLPLPQQPPRGLAQQ